jgi:hypothetical protein
MKEYPPMSDRVPPKTVFTLTVRKRHYETAVCGSNARCVLAVALREAFPGLEVVNVGTNSFATIGPDYLDEWNHDGEIVVSHFDAELVNHTNAPAEQRVTFKYDSRLSYGEVERRDGAA